jgi:hypothetical protein
MAGRPNKADLLVRSLEQISRPLLVHIVQTNPVDEHLDAEPPDPRSLPILPFFREAMARLEEPFTSPFPDIDRGVTLKCYVTDPSANQFQFPVDFVSRPSRAAFRDFRWAGTRPRFSSKS